MTRDILAYVEDSEMEPPVMTRTDGIRYVQYRA